MKAASSIKSFITNIFNSPIRFFVFTSLIFGLGFIVLVPPFQIPDEFVHFSRSYEVSELQTAHPYHQKDIDHLGSMMPKSLLLTYEKTRLHRLPGYPDVAQAKKYDRVQTEAAFNIPLNKSEKIFYDTGSTPRYFPGLYIPQAVAISLLKIFNAPAILMLYATRVVGLLVWILLATLALKILQPASRRLAMAAVLLLPMFVAQASASTDPIINGLIVLYLAVVANHFLNKKTPARKVITCMIIILTLAALSKPVYALFGLLLLLLPFNKKGRIAAIYKTATLLAPFLLVLIWSSLTKQSGGPYYIDAIAISHANPSEQVAFLVPNLLNFVQPFINTLLLGWGDNVLVSLIGEFGKLDTPLPILFVIMGYFIVFIAAFGGTDEKSEAKLAKNYYLLKSNLFLGAALTVLYIGGVYLAMYIYSTPPEEKIITGIQGRYLLPLVPLGVLFAAKNWLIIREKIYRIILIAVPLLLLTASLVVVFLRFWIEYPKG